MSFVADVDNLVAHLPQALIDLAHAGHVLIEVRKPREIGRATTEYIQ